MITEPHPWPEVNGVVEGLRDALGDALGQLAGLYVSGSLALGASTRLPWPELVDQALGWRADQRPDDDRLAATLGLVADAVARARTAG